MGGCRHRSVAVGGSRKRSAAAKRRTARRVYTLHGSATWLGCSPTTGRRAAIFSNGASKINHLWSKKGSSAPVLVCGGWFCRDPIGNPVHTGRSDSKSSFPPLLFSVSFVKLYFSGILRFDRPHYNLRYKGCKLPVWTGFLIRFCACIRSARMHLGAHMDAWIGRRRPARSLPPRAHQ